MTAIRHAITHNASQIIHDVLCVYGQTSEVIWFGAEKTAPNSLPRCFCIYCALLAKPIRLFLVYEVSGRQRTEILKIMDNTFR